MALLACNRAGEPQPPSPLARETTPATAAPAETSKPPAATTPVVPERFTALGTEPFWAAEVAGERLTYTTPEDQAGQTVAVARTASAQSVEFSGTLAGKPLALTLSKGPCSDGMSDTVYPLHAVRRLGDEVQRGCARPD